MTYATEQGLAVALYNSGGVGELSEARSVAKETLRGYCRGWGLTSWTETTP